MKYVKVMQTSDLSSGSRKKISLEGHDILLTNFDGIIYAISNTCPHMGGSLYDGELDGKIIKCPRHGTQFDVTNGKVTSNGKILFIKLNVKDVLTYPIMIEGTDVLIGIE